MGAPRVTSEEFVAAWHRNGCSPTAVAKDLTLDLRSVYSRRKKLSDQGYSLPTHTEPHHESKVPPQYLPEEGWTWPREKRLWIDTGSIIVFSDCHYWPGEPSIAHRALVEVIRAIKPRVAIANGDVFDGGTIGRHPPFGFSTRPTAVQELHACQERLGDVEQAMPNGSELLWNIGNHCLRWERTLATQAEQFAGLHGLRLADHFAAWEFQWSVLINADSKSPVMVKHRFANGIHAAYNNAMKGGLSIVTGHTHHLEVKPYVDYRGRRYGVQCGTLADTNGPQFEYQENSPSPATSGFAVLTFRNGTLLAPELCEVIDGAAWFRGEPVA